MTLQTKSFSRIPQKIHEENGLRIRTQIFSLSRQKIQRRLVPLSKPPKPFNSPSSLAILATKTKKRLDLQETQARWLAAPKTNAEVKEIVQRNEKESPLLRLPILIRAKILNYLFSAPYSTRKWFPWPFWNPFNFVTASRQIYFETRNYYHKSAAMRPFTTSVFQFDHDWQIGEFLSVLNRVQRHAITKIRVQYDDVIIEEDSWDLTCLTGLQLVVVTEVPTCASQQDLAHAMDKLQGRGKLPTLMVHFKRPGYETSQSGLPLLGLYISYHEDVEPNVRYKRAGYPTDWTVKEAKKIIDLVDEEYCKCSAHAGFRKNDFGYRCLRSRSEK